MVTSTLCKIADLITAVPTAGGMFSRCEEYLYREERIADIVIQEEAYRRDRYPNRSDDLIAYMESGYQFYQKLLFHDGMMMHASAVAMENRAYLFSGVSGVGKTTHTCLWKQLFGEAALVFNDDKPALRRIDGCWHAYGTPWCGKDGININMKVPIAGICFMKQADENSIRRLKPQEALFSVISQTPHRFTEAAKLDMLLVHVEKLINEIPIFELCNRPEADAARLSYETMCAAAKEAGI